MKKSSVLQNKKVARQRNRRLKRRQRSLRQWLARLAKTRHSLASFVVAREPAPAGARGFYKGGPPPRRRSPTVERLLWSGNVEYRLFSQNFGGQPLRKQRPVAITEPPSRLPLTPSSLVERVIVCSESDFLGDHRRLCPLSSPVSVRWGPLPEAGALRVITPAPEPERLFSAQFQPRAWGQAGSGPFSGLPERPWPLEAHAPALLKSRCSWGDLAASGRVCYQGKLTVVASIGSAKPTVDDGTPGTEQPASSDKNGRINRRVYVVGEHLRRNIRSDGACGIKKSYRLCKKLSSRKGLNSAKNQRDCLGKLKGATPRARGWSRTAAGASLKKRELLRASLRESQTMNRYCGHSTQLPLSARTLSKKPGVESSSAVIDNNLPEPDQRLLRSNFTIVKKEKVFRKFIAEPYYQKQIAHKGQSFSDDEEPVIEKKFQECSALNQTTKASAQHFTGHSAQGPAVPEEISPELLAEFYRVRQEDAAYLAAVRIIVCFGERDSHAGLPSGTLCPECWERRFSPILLDDSW